ncbi:TrkH family potassium uptake protein [Neogemmobacter tilapiae]|uniref:Trk system potassium uptake protein n=1 Tax=Neogemmobacter tilapiae TaxID=875041 RepID=A0A918WHR8_9RHOB|nr:TrkH family potassium uptake protein [Gemmobacter tilapiae]GHC44992.1 Trk system potassium uptake protein [Gemmobacter tilapiae]
MQDIRPVFYVIGLMLVALAGLMLIPASVDAVEGNGNAGAFFTAALISGAIGGLVALSTRNGVSILFDTRQAYLITTLAWIIVSFFGCLPFMLGAPGLNLTDAYFESVSGITTTGSTVIVGLDNLPSGVNLWRGMLNGIGGLGIAFVAMIFLPVMRVGGMQFFRVQGYDTLGKVLPRASDIALSLLGVYSGLIVACMATYSALGMTPLDAVVTAMSTIATGGFAPMDASFSKYPGPIEYAAILFMFLGAMPYIRFVQLVAGDARPLWRDSQVRSMARWILTAAVLVTIWRVWAHGGPVEETFRRALFNLISIMTTTGFGSGDFGTWGGFALVVAFVVGMIGGCSGSSSAALSVFRVQVIIQALWAQARQISSPRQVIAIKYDGRTVDDETMDGLIFYTTAYILLLGVLSVFVTLLGVDGESALFGVWASIGNIGYAIGPATASTATFVDFPDSAKWVMTFSMLLGRVALLAAFVLLMPRFWRA